MKQFRVNCIAFRWDLSTSNGSFGSAESCQNCKFMKLVDVDGV